MAAESEDGRCPRFEQKICCFIRAVSRNDALLAHDRRKKSHTHRAQGCAPGGPTANVAEEVVVGDPAGEAVW
jgi:hypothetical protein